MKFNYFFQLFFKTANKHSPMNICEGSLHETPNNTLSVASPSQSQFCKPQITLKLYLCYAVMLTIDWLKTLKPQQRLS